MNLNDYAKNFAKHVKFPDKLVLSNSLADDFYSLWEEGERRGIEIGYNMIYDDQKDKLVPDKNNKFEGAANYINFPDQSPVGIYGDIHTHPANSIGHVNGYSAHSLQDIKGLGENADKPLFIRFVASKSYIYAMLYRQGLSKLDGGLFQSLMTELEGKIKDVFLKKTGMTEDQRVDQLGSFGSQNEAEMWMLNAKKKAPGFGVEIQRLSVDYCVKVANEMNLGFYLGRRSKFERSTNQEITLKRKE